MAEAGDEPHRKARVLDDQPQNFWAHEESKDEQSTGSTLTSGSAASRTKRGSRGSKGDAPRRSRLSRLKKGLVFCVTLRWLPGLCRCLCRCLLTCGKFLYAKCRGKAYGRTHVVAVDAGEEVKDDGDDGAVTLDPDLDDGKPKMLLEIPDDDFVIPTRGVRGFCYRLQMHPVFENLITLAVLVSLTPIIPSVKADMQDLLGRHPIEGDDDEAETSCFRMNCMYYVLIEWICGPVFVLEVVVKMTAFLPKDYFKDWFNRLDFFLMLLWIMDVGLGSGTNLSFLKSLKALKSLKSMKALKSLKTLKVLRLLKFGKYIDPLFRAFKRWLLRWIADTRLASEVHLQKGQGAQSDWRAKRSLPAKLEMLKKGFQHAKREYAVSFEEFERDHELEITNFEAIVDTAALGYLIAQFKPNASIWRLVLIAETLIFCILVTWLKATQQPWVICVAGALVRFVFGLWTFLKRPYMFTREGQVDSLTRQTTIFLLVLGALLDLTRDPGFGMEMEADQAEKLRYYVDIIGAALLYGTILRILFLLRAHEMAHDAVVAAIRYCDEQVLTLIIGLIDVKCYAFEDCNLGLQVLRQWDVLIDRQQATKLRAWPSPNPSNLLTLYQKGVLVKWAAARDLRISTFRTPTGQCILHSAMLKGEPEIVAWILYHHPELLTVCDDQRDSPVVIALKELAFTLLKHQKKPTEATAWKRAKLAEILLSDQIQCCALDHIAVQSSCSSSRWPSTSSRRRASCASPSDIGARTFEALTAALEMPQTTITIPSNFFQSYPIYIVRIDARMNRLDGKMGQFAARAIAANKTLTYLDLRYNNIDDDGGVALAKALKKNESLTLVSLAQNRLGPNAGDALGSMMRRNITIRTLNLADNQLGPCLSYSNEYTRDFLPSSGPKICHALRVNGTITALDVSNNRLGADAAQALDQSFRRNPQSALRTLGFAGNELRADGGKHLAHALRSRVQLTHLDASRNRFGAGVGVAFAAALKKNHHLVHLDLKENGLGTKSGRGLALALQENKSLASLDLAANGFGPDVLRSCSAALLKAPGLTYLNLARNDLALSSHEGGEPEMCGGMLGTALQGNKTLTALDLGGVKFDPEEGLSALTGFARNAALRDVSFAGQPFDNANALNLTNCLEQHRHRERRVKGRPNTSGGSRPNTGASRPGTGKSGKGDLKAGADHGLGLVDVVQTPGLQAFDVSGCSVGQRAGLCGNQIFNPTSIILKFGQDHPNQWLVSTQARAPVCIAALVALPRLTALRVGGNGIGAKLGERVAEIFTEGCELDTLDVSANSLGETGGLTIARAMELNVTLTDVDMSRNELNEEVGSAVADALIELVESGFVARGPRTASVSGEEVARCLRRSTVQWSRLDLEGNDLGKDGVNPIMWALRLNCTLTELLLSNNGIGGDFGTDRDRRGHYGNSLQGAVEYNFTLKRLDLAHNDISHECATGLAYAMVENPSLVALNFEKNHLDARAAEALSDRLRRDAQIRYLNLRRNDVSWQGAIRLANALETNLGILHLDLGFNGVGSCGPIAGRALADMICKNAILRHLDLEGNDIGPDAGAAIAAALMRNNTLQFINMINNHLENETGEAFLKALRVNSGIMECHFSVEEIGEDRHGDIRALMKKRASLDDNANPDIPCGGANPTIPGEHLREELPMRPPSS
ncbi:hypothetical protein JL720_1688 [Aureococcus anophagefferens]|nr:hypothetical protein JL720_1688 [Aureococcus anophagefferens]